MIRVRKKRRTNVLLRLQQEYNAALRQHRLLILQNELLRQREQFLLEAVQEQGDNLHYVALAAFQQEQQLLQACTCASPDACTCGAGEAAAITASLLEDLKVYEMLQMVGGAAATGGAADPNTTQWMRAAITPERVAQIRKSSLEDIAAKLGGLTMRLSHLLHTPPAKLALLSTTMEDVVFEYGEMGMLLHVAADRSNLEIGVLNLETLQRQEPPEGHWEYVLESLELRPEQSDSLCTGFEQYIATSAPVIAEMQELGRRMQQLTGAPAHAIVSAAAEGTPSTSLDTGEDDKDTDTSSSSSSSGESDEDIDDIDASAADGEGSGGSRGLLDGSDNGNGKLPMPCTAAAAQQQDAGASVLKNEDSAAPMDWQQQQHKNTQQLQQVQHPLAERPMHDQHPQHENNDKEQQQQQQQQQSSYFDTASTHLQTLEVFVELEETMKQLLNRVMKLRELHRTVTFLWLNTLDTRQQALSVVNSYPFWSRPLSMTRILAQQRGFTDPTTAGTGTAAAAAAAGRPATGAAAGAAASKPRGTSAATARGTSALMATTRSGAQPVDHQRKASADFRSRKA